MVGWQLRAARAEDRTAVSELVFESTNGWYRAQGKALVFDGEPADCAVFFDLYEALDPGRCLVAERPGGQLIGSCFWHPRPTHVSLGIMNVHPEAFGLGVARGLLDAVCSEADARGLPVRLISSAQNLDSFSLYNRAGFVPHAVFQDMVLPVPDEGVLLPDKPAGLVRDARLADLEAMVELEFELLGIERPGDLRHLIEDRSGIWTARVHEVDQGIDGFLFASDHPASRVIGPGGARSMRSAEALVTRELNARWRGRAPLILGQSARPEWTRWLAARGARNVELHVLQSRGPYRALGEGVVLPTFLPESI